MVLFEKVKKIFKTNNPILQFQEYYSEINRIADEIAGKLNLYLDHLNLLLKNKVDYAKYHNKPTGILSANVEKVFIKEYFLENLAQLSEISSGRYFDAMGQIDVNHRIEILEEDLLVKTVKFLKKINKMIPDINEVYSIADVNERIRRIQQIIVDVYNIIHVEIEKIKSQELLIQKVFKSEIYPLICEVYSNSEVVSLKRNKFLVYRMTESQFKEFEKECERLNKNNDPNNVVIWRYPWRKVQEVEIDRTTEFREPHVNVTIKLGDGKKKKIHIVIDKVA